MELYEKHVRSKILLEAYSNESLRATLQN